MFITPIIVTCIMVDSVIMLHDTGASIETVATMSCKKAVKEELAIIDKENAKAMYVS